MFERIYQQVTRLFSDDRGADLIEYGLIAAMIAAAGVAVFPSIFTKLGGAWFTWGDNVYQAWEPNNPAP